MNVIIPGIEALDSAAYEFLETTKNRKHFAFYGPMGVGKTSFIKALCHQLGVVGVVTSPTFAIVNEYVTGLGEIIYHFDFYRTNNIEELFDLGYEEYLFGSNYCFIEWPEKGESILPEHFLKATMMENSDGTRVINY